MLNLNILDRLTSFVTKNKRISPSLI